MNTNVIREQSGVIAVWQMGPQEQHEARRLLRSGAWKRLTRKVLLASPAVATEKQKAWGAVLHCGEGSAIGGRNALVLSGWRGELGKPFDVVHSSSLRKVPKWIRVRRVDTESKMMAGLPRVSAHDAVLQAAAWADSDRQAMYFVISALQQRVVSAQRLVELLAKRPRLKRRTLIANIVTEYAGGSQSLNELDLGEVCLRHGLPQPTRQVKRLDANGDVRSIDAEFAGPLGTFRVEIEGLQHLDPDQWLADLKRQNGLVLAGESSSLRYSSWTIRYEPWEFVNDMRRALGLQTQPVGKSA